VPRTQESAIDSYNMVAMYIYTSQRMLVLTPYKISISIKDSIIYLLFVRKININFKHCDIVKRNCRCVFPREYHVSEALKLHE